MYRPTYYGISIALIIVVILGVCDLSFGQCLFGDNDDCAFPCHCSTGSTCDSRTGQCYPGQCSAGKSSSDNSNIEWKWHGPGCQSGNVALNKKAISNDHSAAMGDWVSDNAMTNGITRSSTRNCPVIWTMSSKPAAWLVDLEKPHKINGFILYVFSKSVGKLRATVGNTTALSEHVTCSILRNNRKIRKKLEVKLNCPESIIGRYVSIVKDPNLDEQIDTLELCEIAVIGQIYYSVDWTACMDSTFNEVWCEQCLNSYSPDCVKPCQDGKHGLNCEVSCEPCNGPCNPITGKCDDLKPIINNKNNNNQNVKIKNGNKTEDETPDSDSKSSTQNDNVSKSSLSGDTTTAASTLLDEVVFVTHDEGGGIIRDITLGSAEDVTLDMNKNDDDSIQSVVQIQVGTDQQEKSTFNTVKEASTNTATPEFSPFAEIMNCASGYFGSGCIHSCGSCINQQSCDPKHGTCINGCEKWYINGEYDCNTFIPRIDLTIENVVVYPTPYALKVKLYGVTQVHKLVEEFYKGEVHCQRKEDAGSPDDAEKYLLTFYPENGSFMKELSISGLQEDTEYEIAIVIYRMHDDQSNAGNEVTLTASTSVSKPDNYSFIILVVGFVILLLCISGVILYLCIRSRRQKDESTISFTSASSHLNTPKDVPVCLTKIEQDPIYQFIDDGDVKYHLYHDIDELAKKDCKYPIWCDATKLSKDDFTGSVHLISRPPFTRQSYIPEINELDELRRRENLASRSLSTTAINQGYLTTGMINNWGDNQEERKPSVPRYVKSPHVGRQKPVVQGKISKPESDYLLPANQPGLNTHQQAPAHYRSRGVTNECLPDYLVAMNHQRRVHTGYLPMDTHMSSDSISTVGGGGRRGYISCINNTPSPNNMAVQQSRRCTKPRYPPICNENNITSETESVHSDKFSYIGHQPVSYVDMA